MSLPVFSGKQTEVLYLPATGHLVVLGAAGSGKTTLAIHRANHLANDVLNKGRTLLVTYNRTLTRYLEAIGLQGLMNVDVRTYHHFARGYLNARGKMKQNDIAKPTQRLDLITKAQLEARDRHPQSRILQRNPGVLADEFEWISRMGIRTADEYRVAVRIARAGVRITSAERSQVWYSYERYRDLRSEAGFRYDWDEIAVAVLDELRQDTGDRLYKHVVIDEGQDFSPTMLQSLVAAVPVDGTVTFFGDTAQQIYGGRITWRNAGLVVDAARIHRFQENYRNTQQIAAFATALAGGPYIQGTLDMVPPRAPKASGSPPSVIQFTGEADERQYIVEMAARLGKSRRVAILLRDRISHESYYLDSLGKTGVKTQRLHGDMREWDGSPLVWVGTYHAAKGLEFDAVLLPHLNDGAIPNPERIEMLGDPHDVCREDAKLLYVAATRARVDLVLTYSGERTRLLDGIDEKSFRFLVL